MATTLTYETKTCGRCGGSGSYSYCSMYGTRCFGCRGKGTVLSAAGAKASKAITGFIAAHFSVPVKSLTPGMRVKVEPGITRTVVSASFTGLYGAANGVPFEQWSVEFNKPVPSPYGAYSSMGMSGEATMVKAVSGAEWEAVVAFARTIKKGVTLVETPAPAPAVA